MSSRTSTSLVTFVHPFALAGYTDELPPGSYEVLAEDEVVRSLSFTACSRTETHLLIKWASGGSELRPIDHRDLEKALVQDQASTDGMKNSEAALSPSKEQK